MSSTAKKVDRTKCWAQAELENSENLNKFQTWLGEGFTHLAFQRYHEGILSKTQVATHLNMNSRNVDKLEGFLGW